MKDSNFLNWSDYENAGLGDPYADIPKHGGDFAKATAVCINSMMCLRDNEKGVMCPSFRVTGDANFSPGGRSRLIKGWLNGSLDDVQKETIETSMAACVGCKACKRECETNIDVAALRAEYMAETSAYKGRRAKILSALPQLLAAPVIYQILVALDKISNVIPVLARFKTKSFGLRSDKPLPPRRPIQSSSLAKGGNVDDKSPESQKQSVAIFVDTFSKYYYPEPLYAAARFFKKHNYAISFINLEEKVCCGRTKFSQGDIDGASKSAKHLLTTLAQLIKTKTPIIVLEPSCLTMIRDDYPLLKDVFPEGVDTWSEFKSQIYLFEEFVAKEMQSETLPSSNWQYGGSAPIVVHGHCHEKSIGAMKSFRRVLKGIQGLEFTILDGSCCGGAGSFGYEEEHRKMSDDMYAQSLGKHMSNQAQPSVMVTNGFSCKEQLSHHSGQQSIHLAELLDQVT